jgi:hypothetical protein
LLKSHGKTFDLRGFAEGFGEAFDVRGFARAFREACDLSAAGRSFAAGFRDGGELVAAQLRRAAAAVGALRRWVRARMIPASASEYRHGNPRRPS